MTSSRIKTWIIRILFFVVALLGVGLLLLSMLGGTSDSHRRGLEQAFSDFLEADVRIGQLERFNIMPQLVFKTAKIRGTFRDTNDEFMLDNLEIAFGFSDIAMGRRRIENFQLNNFRFSSEAKTDLRVDYAGIEDGAKSIFVMRGEFEKKDFNFSFPVEKINQGRVSYAFLSKHSIDGKFGGLTMTGQVSAEKGISMQHFGNIVISANGQTLLTGESNQQANAVKLDCLPDAKMASPAIRDDIRVLHNIPFIKLSENCPK